MKRFGIVAIMATIVSAGFIDRNPAIAQKTIPAIDPLPGPRRFNKVDEKRYQKELVTQRQKLHADAALKTLSAEEQAYVKQLEDAILGPAHLTQHELGVDTKQFAKVVQTILDDLDPNHKVSIFNVMEGLDASLSRYGIRAVAAAEFDKYPFQRRTAVTLSAKNKTSGDTIWLDMEFVSTGTGIGFAGKKLLEPTAFWTNESKGIMSAKGDPDEALAIIQSHLVKAPRVDQGPSTTKP